MAEKKKTAKLITDGQIYTGMYKVKSVENLGPQGEFTVGPVKIESFNDLYDDVSKPEDEMMQYNLKPDVADKLKVSKVGRAIRNTGYAALGALLMWGIPKLYGSIDTGFKNIKSNYQQVETQIDEAKGLSTNINSMSMNDIGKAMSVEGLKSHTASYLNKLQELNPGMRAYFSFEDAAGVHTFEGPIANYPDYSIDKIVNFDTIGAQGPKNFVLPDVDFNKVVYNKQDKK